MSLAIFCAVLFAALLHALGQKGPAEIEPKRAWTFRQVHWLANRHGIPLFDTNDPLQGIEHVIAPEHGMVRPGMVIICGDSHTTTYGALGALGFGIGTSEVEHVLATQTLIQRKAKNMKVEITGSLRPGVTAKDITLSVIGETGTAGGTGYVIEYCGQAIRELSMEGRMTVCNMAIEAGARAGMVAPDQTTFDWVANTPRGPKGADFDAAVAAWSQLRSDAGARLTPANRSARRLSR